MTLNDAQTPKQQSKGPKSTAPSAIAKLAVLLGCLIVVCGASVALIYYYVNQPGQTVIIQGGDIDNAAARARLAASTNGPSPMANGGPTFTGKVVDAKTHQPVAAFTMQVGFVNAPGQSVNYYNDQPKNFSGGTYSITSRLNGQFDGWFVRVIARGYLPAESPKLNGGDTHDFELTPAADLQGRVLDASGKPVAGVTVALVMGGMSSNINNGKLIDRGEIKSVTGADGRYDLPPMTDNFALLAISDAGFAQLDQNSLPKNGDISLGAWGEIRGQVLIGTQPGAGKQVIVQTPQARFSMASPRIFNNISAVAGQDGSFDFNRVPPGTVQVGRLVIQRSSRYSSSGYTDMVSVDLKPGGSATVKLGGMGRPVTGKLVFQPALAAAQDIILRVNVTGTSRITPPPQMPANVRNGTPAAQDMWMQLWGMTAAGKEYIASHPAVSGTRQYYAEIDADHNFRLDNVTPGDYQMVINVQIINAGRSPQPTVVPFTVPDIPGGVSDDPLVLPDVVVKRN
ncbi:MAG: carboxypeptidase-like regulatory domain-containing protein [Tepidisphaeraceae bacterium]